jgi:hypothetical protein
MTVMGQENGFARASRVKNKKQKQQEKKEQKRATTKKIIFRS